MLRRDQSFRGPRKAEHRQVTCRVTGRRRRFATLAVVGVLALVPTGIRADPPPAADKPSQAAPAKPPIDPRELMVQFENGSRLQVRLTDPYVVIETRYGVLRAPAGEVRLIQVGRRLPSELTERLQQAMIDLAAADPTRWRAALENLVQQGEAAAPSLVRAMRSGSYPLAERATEALLRIQKQHGDRPLELREFDIVEAGDCRIVGRIGSESLGIETPQFGRLSMKLTDVFQVQSLALIPADDDPPPDDEDALPDPGNLSEYAHQIGKTLRFRVVGHAGGSVWGTDVYTSDSTLATAAVHAGVVKLGQSAVVRVKILPGRGSYDASTRHGIAASSYGSWDASYEFTDDTPKLRFR